MNGDGEPDLVIANTGDASVSVFLDATPPGSTKLSFTSTSAFATGSGPQGVALADLNLDGKPDIATANNDGTVSVLLAE